jgi:hypothetical protein
VDTRKGRDAGRKIARERPRRIRRHRAVGGGDGVVGGEALVVESVAEGAGADGEGDEGASAVGEEGDAAGGDGEEVVAIHGKTLD